MNDQREWESYQVNSPQLEAYQLCKMALMAQVRSKLVFEFMKQGGFTPNPPKVENNVVPYAQSSRNRIPHFCFTDIYRNKFR